MVMKVTQRILFSKPNLWFTKVQYQKTQRIASNWLKNIFFCQNFQDSLCISGHKISQIGPIFNSSTSPVSPFNLPVGVWGFPDPRITFWGLKLCPKLKKRGKMRETCAFWRNFYPLQDIKLCQKIFCDKSRVCRCYPESLVELGAFWGVLQLLEITLASFS